VRCDLRQLENLCWRENRNCQPAQEDRFQNSGTQSGWGFCFFGGVPLFEDGTEVSTEFLPDMNYCFLLQKKLSGWEVVADFSGSDVPEPEWWQGTQGSLRRPRLRQAQACGPE